MPNEGKESFSDFLRAVRRASESRDLFSADDHPDPETLDEARESENELKRRVIKEQIREASLRNDAIKADNSNREGYAKKIFWLVLGWLAVVVAIVIASGIPWLREHDFLISLSASFWL